MTFEIRWDNGNRTLYIKDEAGTYYYSHTASKATRMVKQSISCGMASFDLYGKREKHFISMVSTPVKNQGPGLLPANSHRVKRRLGDEAASMLFTTPVLIGPELLIGGMVLAFGGLKYQRCIYTVDMDSGRIY